MVMCSDILSEDDYAIQMMVAGMVGREDNNAEVIDDSANNLSEDDYAIQIMVAGMVGREDNNAGDIDDSADNLSDDDYVIQMMVSDMVRREDNNFEHIDALNNHSDSCGEFLQPLRQRNDPHNASIAAVRDQKQEQNEPGSYSKRNVTKREVGTTFTTNMPQIPVLQPLSIDVGKNIFEPQNKDFPIIENVSKEFNKVNIASPKEEQPIPQVQDKENLYPLNAVISSSSSSFTPPKKKFREASISNIYTDAFDDIVTRASKAQKFRSFRPRPGMSNSILGSTSKFRRPTPPPPMTTENWTQTGHYAFLKALPIATSWTLPVPWAIPSYGTTTGTQTNPKDTVEITFDDTPKEDFAFKFDQDFKSFVNENDTKDYSFGSIENCDSDQIPEFDHSGVYIGTATRFDRDIATNTAHVPWRRIVRRVPKFKKWIKSAKSWNKTKDVATDGTQTDEPYSYLLRDFDS